MFTIFLKRNPNVLVDVTAGGLFLCIYVTSTYLISAKFSENYIRDRKLKKILRIKGRRNQIQATVIVFTLRVIYLPAKIDDFVV